MSGNKRATPDEGCTQRNTHMHVLHTPQLSIHTTTYGTSMEEVADEVVESTQGICTEIIGTRFGIWEIKCSIPLGSAHPRPGRWTPFLSNTQAAPPISAEGQLCSEQESKISEVPLVLTVTAGWLSDKGAIANI